MMKFGSCIARAQTEDDNTVYGKVTAFRTGSHISFLVFRCLLLWFQGTLAASCTCTNTHKMYHSHTTSLRHTSTGRRLLFGNMQMNWNRSRFPWEYGLMTRQSQGAWVVVQPSPFSTERFGALSASVSDSGRLLVDVIFSAFCSQHHCRSCGKVYCSTCCDKKVQLPSSK